jgi:predicted nucleotidyltransferase
MIHESTQRNFNEALDGLIESVKEDRSILAAILCGSLSHDTVWDKSDIDLLLVTIDDRKVEPAGRALYAGGVNVHAFLMPRAKFRQTVEGTIRNSFMHSLLAKGRLLYTRDETIADLCAGLGELGERDTEVQLLAAATSAIGSIYKARKWFLTRGDLEYTALWILYAATPLAKVEVIGARRIADREVIPQAMKLNPSFFKIIYSDLLNLRKTPRTVEAALDAVDDYLRKRATSLFASVLEHLREVGEARSSTDIEDHFTKNFGVEGITAACEYLADLALVGKASIPVQLTRRSNTTVEELAFFHLQPGAGDRRQPARGKARETR